MPDEIERAMVRNKILPGSALERLVREQFFYIVGTSDEKRDEKLDKFIQQQAENPAYADSLENRPAPKAKQQLNMPVGVRAVQLSEQEFERLVDWKGRR